MPEELQTVGTYSIAGALALVAIRFPPILRRLIPLVLQLVQVLLALWEQNEVKLEQDERRARRRRRESTQPQSRSAPSKMPSLDAAPEFVAEESTDVVDIREAIRKRAPGGFRPPRPGTHHDRNGED